MIYSEEETDGRYEGDSGRNVFLFRNTCLVFSFNTVRRCVIPVSHVPPKKSYAYTVHTRVNLSHEWRFLDRTTLLLTHLNYDFLTDFIGSWTYSWVRPCLSGLLEKRVTQKHRQTMRFAFSLHVSSSYDLSEKDFAERRFYNYLSILIFLHWI